MDFELVIFDLDGVLVNTSPLHERAYNELWELLGISGPRYEAIAGRKTIDVIRAVTSQMRPAQGWIEEWANFKQERARHYLESDAIAFDDSAECIGRLIGKGQRLALGTGASRKTTEMILSRFDWESAFPVVVTGEDVETGKPAPDIYELAIQCSGAAANRTLIVEDSQAGLSAAAAANAFSVSVRSGASIDDERFVGIFPDLRSITAAMESDNR
jgi:HAD superfamily hydrolase (TIGR01509 family)